MPVCERAERIHQHAVTSAGDNETLGPVLLAQVAKPAQFSQSLVVPTFLRPVREWKIAVALHKKQDGAVNVADPQTMRQGRPGLLDCLEGYVQRHDRCAQSPRCFWFHCPGLFHE